MIGKGIFDGCHCLRSVNFPKALKYGSKSFFKVVKFSTVRGLFGKMRYLKLKSRYVWSNFQKKRKEKSEEKAVDAVLSLFYIGIAIFGYYR